MVQVIEGTWEEIKLHEAEFAGRHLRVIVDAEPAVIDQADIDRRLEAWKAFCAMGVEGVIVDDGREGIYGNDLDRG